MSTTKHEMGIRWYHDAIMWGSVVGVNAACVIGQFEGSIGILESIAISWVVPMPVIALCMWHSCRLFEKEYQNKHTTPHY